jgi:hypothetical protein
MNPMKAVESGGIRGCNISVWLNEFQSYTPNFRYGKIIP